MGAQWPDKWSIFVAANNAHVEWATILAIIHTRVQEMDRLGRLADFYRPESHRRQSWRKVTQTKSFPIESNRIDTSTVFIDWTGCAYMMPVDMNAVKL